MNVTIETISNIYAGEHVLDYVAPELADAVRAAMEFNHNGYDPHSAHVIDLEKMPDGVELGDCVRIGDMLGQINMAGENIAVIDWVRHW